MLPERHRLRQSADVQNVRRYGRGWRHPLVILLVQANELNVSRFAFVASRRVGNAVMRNKAKRLMRESIRLQLERIEEGWDCVLLARSAAPGAPFADVDAAVQQLLNRASLLVRTPATADRGKEFVG